MKTSHHDSCTVCASLYAINPKEYPKTPALSDAEKAENRRWVAEQRAKRSGK